MIYYICMTEFSAQFRTREERPVPYSHDSLVKLFNGTLLLNNDTLPEKYTYFCRQFDDFTEQSMATNGTIATFGTGYPFYGLDHDNRMVLPIDEMNRYVAEQQTRALAGGAIILSCIECQFTNQLPDLKKFCKPCPITGLKPRGIFKALPDLDYWVIAEEDSRDYRLRLQDNLSRIGFFPSDPNIGASLADIDYVLNSYKKPEYSNGERVYAPRFPIDLHVITEEDFSHLTNTVKEKMNEYARDSSIDCSVPVSPYSLHTVWERPDEPYDFTNDFLFSLTLHEESASSIKEMFDSLKQSIEQKLSHDDIINILSRNEALKRRLDSLSLRRVLNGRFDTK